MSKSFSGLRPRLISIVLFAILPSLGLLLYTNLEQRRHAIADARHETLRLTSLVVSEQEALLQHTRQLLSVLAQVPDIQSGHLAECQALLANLLTQYPAYTNFGVANLAGEVTCSGLPLNAPVNIADRRYFQRALENEDFAAGEYQIGRITDKPAINFGYPLRADNGQLLGVVYAALDLAWLNRLAADAQLPAGSALVALDHNGTVLARYPDPQMWVGQVLTDQPLRQTMLVQSETTQELPGLDGVTRLYTLLPFPNPLTPTNGVHLGIGIPVAEVLAEVNRQLTRNLILLGLVAGAAFALAWLLSDRLVLNNINTLVRATRQLAAGDLATRTQLSYEKGELGQLAAAFDRMAEALQKREAERNRAEANLRAQNRQLSLLNWIITASAADLEPETFLETACRELAQTFNLPQATIALLNEDRTLVAVAAEYRAEGQPLARDINLPVAQLPALQEALDRQSSLIIDDAQQDPRLSAVHQLLRQRGTVSMLLVPLIMDELAAGIVALEATQPRQFTIEETGLAWSVADQVARTLVTARLNQERRLLSTAVEQTAGNVIITDAAGLIRYINPACEQTTGYSAAEVVGHSPRLFASGTHPASYYQALWETISAGQVWHGRFINQKKDGSHYTVDSVITPVRGENGALTHYVAVQQDISRELSLEEQYHQAQKMEAMGRLAGGVAHDFNNLLTAINGFTELAQLQLAPDHPIQEMLSKVLASGQRAINLVRQLLTFSRKQVIEPKLLNINDVVTDLEKMLQRIIGEDLQVETNLAADLWPVRVDPTQIEQVIVNLAVNARDAMPEGGRLTIETANIVLDEGYAAGYLGAKPGDYVLLAVSDTGLGMDQQTQARIFEPFFTTKEPGKGTGLGLATVFGMVKQNGGDIHVYSEVSHGTTFKIYLPRTQEAAPAPGAAGQVRGIPRGVETILLVEDNPTVRELASLILNQQGYQLLEAANGREALALAQSYQGEIHLLLTDVIMPQLGGGKLADELTASRPRLKVLYMSGYTDDAIIRHGVLEPGVAFIQKPFSPAALAQKVRDVLDSSS